MADKARYPQIPSTVWWGLRAILAKNPSATITPTFLSVELKVQDAAAKQYVLELSNIGIITEEGKATPLALKWCLDDGYEQAVDALLASTYPQELRDVAPPDGGDRQKAKRWFMQAGFGEGAAGNKAATYFLVGTKNISESPIKTSGTRSTKSTDPSSTANRRTSQAKQQDKKGDGSRSKAQGPQSARGNEPMPLNVNLQIHISADAGSEQIEAIFGINILDKPIVFGYS